MKISKVIITGIHTEIGKTITAGVITKKFNAYYWKPIQSGLINNEGDKEFIQKYFKVPPEKILPETYRLYLPASPHFSAAQQDIYIEPDKIVPPSKTPLVIEGAGGLMVPLNNNTLFIDLFQKWNLPVILVVNTYLGAINHTLLSIEALKNRNINLLGIITSGDVVPSTLKAILDFGKVKLLGQIPKITDFTRLEIEKLNFEFELD